MVAMLILTLLAGIAIWAYLRSTNQAGTPPVLPTSTVPQSPTSVSPTTEAAGPSTYVPPPPPPQLPPYNSGNAPMSTGPMLETRTGIGHFGGSGPAPVVNPEVTSNADYAGAILAQGPPAGSVQPPGTYWNYVTKSWTPLLA